MKIDIKKFKWMKKEAIEEYNKIDQVFCPYLGEDVVFNNKGLRHLRFKSWNRSRSVADQYMRFKLLKFAVKVLKDSYTLQEFSESKNLERVQINSRWEQRAVAVKYYGFVAIIDEVRIKVIVKEVKSGNKFFWSLIPCWKQDRGKLNKKILHIGNLEDD